MTDVRDHAAPAAATAKRGNSAGSFIWYELMTPDIAGAKKFYDSVVGWRIEDQSSFPNGYRMIGRSDGKSAGGILPLTAEMESHGARPAWLAYISVDDVDEQAAGIEADGGKLMMPPFDIPNIGRVALVTDPAGAPFYIMKPIPPANEPETQSDVFSLSEPQRVGWNELQTSDEGSARAFYGERFGWGSEEYMDMGPMGLYRFWDYQGTRIGALLNPNNGQPPHWRFYFRVPSITKAKEIAEAGGGTIHMGPHQVPSGDYVVIGSDPQGAEFALVGGE